MDIFIDHIKNNLGVIVGLCLVLIATLNSRLAAQQQDEAYNMPEDSDTEKICRQIRMLETRIWLLSYWIIIALGLILVFV